MGNIAYQLPFAPITFSLDTRGNFRISLGTKIVTPLGTVGVSGGIVTKVSDGKPLPPDPADVTQLVICQQADSQKLCEAYQISTGRKISIAMNGQFLAVVERNRITIDAEPGSTIILTDDGPPTKTDARGPARIDVEEWDYIANVSTETEVDLERSRSGTTTDLSYDHVTGELKPINGAQVSRVVGYVDWPPDNEDLPGENDCAQASDWSDSFRKKDLETAIVIACVKTAEADLGYLVITPDRTKKPAAFHMYSYTWVR